MCNHKEFMKEASILSHDNIRNGIGGPFGAVIVKDGKIIGKGNNQVTSTNDPTAHAEMVAIRDACRNEGSFHLEGAVIYTSCEPCPMCLSAIYWAHIDKIYYSNTRVDAARIGFDDEFLYQEVKKDMNDRKIPIERVEVPEAKDAFDDWHTNDKYTRY